MAKPTPAATITANGPVAAIKAAPAPNNTCHARGGLRLLDNSPGHPVRVGSVRPFPVIVDSGQRGDGVDRPGGQRRAPQLAQQLRLAGVQRPGEDQHDRVHRPAEEAQRVRRVGAEHRVQARIQLVAQVAPDLLDVGSQRGVGTSTPRRREELGKQREHAVTESLETLRVVE
ncbi:MAG: hypothetical protein ACRDTF_06775 [Pseudonocardiaceae bacterium]